MQIHGLYKLFQHLRIDNQSVDEIDYKLFYRKKCAFPPFGIRKKRVFLRLESKHQQKWK